MSYPRPIHTRSIKEIYSGKLHPYGINIDRPVNPYAQYHGILRYLRAHLERSAEERHLKTEADKEKKELTPEQLEAKREKDNLEINERIKRRMREMDQLEGGPYELG